MRLKVGREPFEDYYYRILEKEAFSHIPKEVFIQWIHEHHDNDYMAKITGGLIMRK